MDAVQLTRLTGAIRVSLLHAAEAADAWRIAPRAFVFCYLYWLHDVTQWFMALKDPSTAQTTFATAIWGFLMPLLGWYMSTGRKWGQQQTRTEGGGGLLS